MSKIPRLVHVIWIQGEEHYDKREKQWSRTPGGGFKGAWARHMPSWRLKLWSGADIRALLKKRYPEQLRLYDHPKTPFAMQADIGRVAIMHSFGGMYADITTQVIRDFDWVMRGPASMILMHNDVSSFMQDVFRIHTNNCWFAAEPRHPITATMLAAMAEVEPRDKWSGGTVCDATGPQVLWAAAQKHKATSNIKFISSIMVDPVRIAHSMPRPIPTDEKALQEALPATVALHRGMLSYAEPWERAGVDCWVFLRKNGTMTVLALLLLLLLTIIIVTVLACHNARLQKRLQQCRRM